MTKKIKPVYEGAEPAAELVYICSVCAALMNVLCKSRFVVTTIIMTVVCGGMYMLFYFLRRRKKLVLLAYMALHIIVTVLVCNIGSLRRSPSFAEFLFNSSDFFQWDYALLAIVGFSLLIGFTVCYFSAFLPKAGFLLLPAFIPLMLGARTLGSLSIGIIVFLAVGYMTGVMGMAVGEMPNRLYIKDPITKKHRRIAIAVFAAVGAAVLLVLPTAERTPFLDKVDNAFLNRKQSIYGGSTLTNFLNNSQPNRGANNPSDNVLFSVKTDYPQNLIRWSFDIYEGENGWSYSEDFNKGTRYWKDRKKLTSQTQLASILKTAAENGLLEKYSEKLLALDDAVSYNGNMTIQVRDGSASKVVMHPTGTYNATYPSYDFASYRNDKDEIFVLDEVGKNPLYMLQYYVDEPNESFIRMLDSTSFITLLRDAKSEGVIDEERYSAVVLEYTDARRYLYAFDDDVPTEIKELAEEITAGIEGDYDKARAIESWFKDAGFVYDMDFVPDECTAEYFLFESKRGICSDFATATTLLLRAAGIPARYTEGFALSEDILDEYGIFNVTPAQAHAFSTAYIEGYGWIEIDGTKYANPKEDYSWLRTVLAVLIAAAVVLLVLGVVFREQLSELLFKWRFGFMSKERRITEVYLRTRRLSCQMCGKPQESTGADEVRVVIENMLGAGDEAAEITAAADMLLYGGAASGAIDGIDEKRLYECYRRLRKIKKSKKI